MVLKLVRRNLACVGILHLTTSVFGACWDVPDGPGRREGRQYVIEGF